MWHEGDDLYYVMFEKVHCCYCCYSVALDSIKRSVVSCVAIKVNTRQLRTNIISNQSVNATQSCRLPFVVSSEAKLVIQSILYNSHWKVPEDV